MSSYGAKPINSGPLEIRKDTYFLNSSSPDSEIPISSNLILITSSNGLLAPSNQIYISSIACSSITGNTTAASSTIASVIQLSTLSASRTSLSATSFSSISGSSISGKSMIFTSTLSTLQASTLNTTFSSIIGTEYSILNTSTLQNNSNFIASTCNVTFSTISFENMVGTNYVISPSISSYTLSISLLSTISISTNILSTNSIIYTNLSTNSIFYKNTEASSLIISSHTINSTLTTSTLTTTNLAFTTLKIDSVNMNSVTVLDLSISTISGSTIVYSTLYGNNLVIGQSYTSLGTYSTLTESSIITSSLSFSTLFASTLFGSTITSCTIVGSTITTSQSNYSSIFGSSILTSTLSILSGTYSTIIGSTTFISTLNTSILLLSTLFGSTSRFSTITTTNGSVSTMVGSTITVPNIFISSLIVSSLITSSITTSTLNSSTLFTSSIVTKSLILSSLFASSFNLLNINNGSLYNTILGYSSFSGNLSGTNNTGFGYATLANTTSGSYHTAVGTGALSYITTGSSNTVIGASTFLTTGSYNTYLGYGAAPSNSNVVNEIVIGGTYSNTLTNTGKGSNTLVLGNTNTITTQLYGNVGINTTNPATTLDVRGSYTQTGGNMNITNNLPNSFQSLFIYNDNATGMGIFLNGSNRTVDGGASTATLRNDYGNLRLQGATGNTNGTYGIIISTNMVGIGSTIPISTLDVSGGARFTDYITISGNNGIALNGTTSNSIYVAGIDTYNPVGTNNLMIQSNKIGFRSSDGVARIRFDTQIGSASFASTITATQFVGTLSGNCIGSAGGGITGGTINATTGYFTQNVGVNGTLTISSSIYKNILPSVNSLFAAGSNTGNTNIMSMLMVYSGAYLYSNDVLIIGNTYLHANTAYYVYNPLFPGKASPNYASGANRWATITQVGLPLFSSSDTTDNVVNFVPMYNAIYSLSFTFSFPSGSGSIYISKNTSYTQDLFNYNTLVYQYITEVGTCYWSGLLLTTDYVRFGIVPTSDVNGYSTPYSNRMSISATIMGFF